MKNLEIPVDEYTSPVELVLSPDENVVNAVKKMNEVSYRHFPVVKDGKAVGIVSQRDLILYKFISESHNIKVEDVMSEQVFTVQQGSTLEETVYMMSEKKIGSAVVLNENKNVYGIFTSTDAMNALVEVLRGEA